jgi:hypothetical protein
MKHALLGCAAARAEAPFTEDINSAGHCAHAQYRRGGEAFTAGPASLFTAAVGTWDGVQLSRDAQQARKEEGRAGSRGKRQRHYDTHEAEYDRGRLKKPLRQALAREAAAAAPAVERARGGWKR